jgi:hypothetical protein
MVAVAGFHNTFNLSRQAKGVLTIHQFKSVQIIDIRIFATQGNNDLY